MKFIRKPAKKFEEGYCFFSCDADCSNFCVIKCDVYSCDLHIFCIIN
ncbi:hypothetical protein UT300012_27430 [Paraclostridium bifermentans]|jgi:Cys-rich peptide (Clo7bot family)|nr:Clo7bot family Cys-rich peptide [Paraclostridium bifermentans]MBU5289235.1 Clo7bot family Cys-rich peptide [Paraclostridium bifermentans]RDC49454.1 Clo7bot family Cys-rich peptide [Acinetobacter sp. RIT592]